MKNLYALLIVLGILTLWVCPEFAYADRDEGHHEGHHGEHQYYHYHDHPHFGVHVAAFYPDEYFPVWAGGTRYYYDDGIYYGYAGGDYVVVNPPVGAVVSTIPPDFQPVVINTTTYYTNNGVYYVYTSHGYQVVSPPVPASVSTQNAVTVNVPSDRGGYVTVVLKRSGGGFVGPEGEFYPVFPRVSQLQAMYGR